MLHPHFIFECDCYSREHIVYVDIDRTHNELSLWFKITHYEPSILKRIKNSLCYIWTGSTNVEDCWITHDAHTARQLALVLDEYATEMENKAHASTD
jgi:hypothetical protein